MTSFHFELTLKREEWNGLGITRPHSYIFYPALYKESRPFIHDVNWPWAIIHGSPSHLLSFIVLHLILIIIISEWSTWTIAFSAQEGFCPSFHCGHTHQTDCYDYLSTCATNMKDIWQRKVALKSAPWLLQMKIRITSHICQMMWSSRWLLWCHSCLELWVITCPHWKVKYLNKVAALDIFWKMKSCQRKEKSPKANTNPEEQ